MKTILRFTTLPPSTNALYANKPGKGRVKSEAYRTWKRVVEAETRGQKCKAISGPVFLTIAVERPPSHVRRDIDNCNKAPIDLLVDWAVIDGDDNRTVWGVNSYWSDDIKGVEIAIVSAAALRGKAA